MEENNEIGPLTKLRDISVNYMTPGTVKGFRRRCAPVRCSDPFEECFLGDEIIKKIFDDLSLRDLANLMLVCKRFYRIVSSLESWEVLLIRRAIMDVDSFHKLLSRGVRKIEMHSPCAIYSDLTINPRNHYDHLVHLDLANVSYESPCLLSVLERTSNLQILNIADYPYLDSEHCTAIAKNEDLFVLNIEQCKGITLDGLSSLCKCENLRELNAAWAQFPSGGAAVICKVIPVGIERLSIAGRDYNELPDLLVELLLNRCGNLVELDVSDCPNLTHGLIDHFNLHPSLKILSICRCYSINPEALLNLDGMSVLNIYGCVTDEGVPVVKRRLRDTIVNLSPLINIAQPSIQIEEE
ncbi:unnamed protein product [Bursaphelenchus xylophilus]|uniref:(pine wood nematode) hypothetical protein n=1 Tax=Bursaphelenchus xylophilus TaxID=6326 RepID=A0A1I7RQ14_BURXY|nr:unnamed protein product [Bursaphelenchus xylophilus]CAG9096974.1 unnamed protein product [Bursaphelenchus xylophilus]